MYKRQIRVYPTLFVAGQFHIWLPMQGFLTEDTGFLRPDPDITITDPGNAPLLLTVSTYNHVTGSLYIHSSRGFTATGQIKPDFAAPGVEVQGPGIPPGTSRLSRQTGSSVALSLIHISTPCLCSSRPGLDRARP